MKHDQRYFNRARNWIFFCVAIMFLAGASAAMVLVFARVANPLCAVSSAVLAVGLWCAALRAREISFYWDRRAWRELLDMGNEDGGKL